MKKEDLHNLFQIGLHSEAPKFTIYTHQVTDRLGYTCEFIFKHTLNCNYTFSEDLQGFKKLSTPKINYSAETIPGVFQIIPHSFIFETGINNTYEPESKLRNELIYFNLNEPPCNLGFDIFSSVFYFISRYQEWQPFEADMHGRFEVKNSIQFKLNQHLKPFVNVWIEELKTALLKCDAKINFPQKKFQCISTIDVDNLYAYKNKGTVRTIGAIAKDVLTFNFKNLNRRLNVLNTKLPDPFDVYDELNALSKKTNIPLIYFFLQRSGTKHDRTIDPATGIFKPVFEKLKQGGINFGLHPSYDTNGNSDLMKKEFSIIQKDSQQEINLSRQHYLRFHILKTPFQLIENKVMADFSMGFASSPGYRAGTFTPFYFYDLEKEKATNLLMVPFAVMDGVYFVYSNSNPSVAEKQIREMATEVKKLNGIFVTVFHERTFDEVLYPGFGELYQKLHEEL